MPEKGSVRRTVLLGSLCSEVDFEVEVGFSNILFQNALYLFIYLFFQFIYFFLFIINDLIFLTKLRFPPGVSIAIAFKYHILIYHISFISFRLLLKMSRLTLNIHAVFNCVKSDYAHIIRNYFNFIHPETISR